jgi:hypothetical protein
MRDDSRKMYSWTVDAPPPPDGPPEPPGANRLSSLSYVKAMICDRRREAGARRTVAGEPVAQVLDGLGVFVATSA